jgi:predicted P-loop ATPase
MVSFVDVGAAALADALILLPQWMGGGERRGHEWVGPRRANGGIGDSWSVNLDTGAWACFADSNVKGGDLVSLYAALNHINNGAALAKVAELVGVTDRPTAPILPRTAAPESVAEPIPEDAPDLPKHHEYGLPSAVYAYGDAFWIARYDLKDGTKQITQHTWRQGKWWGKGYPGKNRPIYNLAGLAKHAAAQVLIVEGEKCAEAAECLQTLVATTWAGGTATVKNNDWSTLKDRHVLIWPDADAPGRDAAAWLGGHLSSIASMVRIINTDRDNGWDVADAIKDGMSNAQIYDWIRAHVGPDLVAKPTPTAPEPEDTKSSHGATEESEPVTEEPATEYLPAKDHPHAEDYPAGQPSKSFLLEWQRLQLDADTKRIPHATLANASAIIQRHEYFRGKVWLDSFRGKVYHTLNGAPRLWTDTDDRRACAWIQQRLQLPKINLNLVKEATLHAAECDQRNSLTDWLDSLKWDGIERLDTWLFDCLGAERNAYNDAVARNWLISMVARAYSPGCQVDTMPVIEGSMGRGKSRFLEVLADPWFAAIQIAFGEKDFFQAIQGRWLIEVPDMSGFSRREHTQILATITTRVDVYRKSHGRITEEHPRVTVFAATSETDDYLQDVRGRRRYWPLRCGDINLDVLKAQREQLFAEAVSKYRAGATWYEMPEQTDEEQILRASHDTWTDHVLLQAEAMWAEPNPRITSSLLLMKVGVELKDQDDGKKSRIARIMRSNNWVQRNNDGRHWKKVVRFKK